MRYCGFTFGTMREMLATLTLLGALTQITLALGTK